MAWLRALGLSAAILSATGTAEASGIVSLTSIDGTLEVSGPLLGYDGDTYRIDSVYGILSVDGDAVTCTGARCPEAGVGQFIRS